MSSKGKKISAVIPDDIVSWMDKKIKRHRFGSYTHAIINALQEMKDRDEGQTR